MQEQVFQSVWSAEQALWKTNERNFYLKLTKKKRFWIVIVIGVLYFAGVAMVIYPMVGNIYSMSTSRSVIKDYEKTVENMSDGEIENKFRLADEYNTMLANGSYDEALSKSLNAENGIMGYVEVPTLNIYLPIYYSTDKDVLLKGCGWLLRTSLPVGGINTHSVISGHTGLPYAEMFTKLDNIKKGDMFYLRILNKTFCYKVDEIETVDPGRTELLHIVDGKDYATLLTCTPYGINDKRLLVRGERVEYSEIESNEAENVLTNMYNDQKADAGLSEQIRGQTLVIVAISLVSILLFAAACVWLRLSTKAEKVKAKYDYKEQSRVSDETDSGSDDGAEILSQVDAEEEAAGKPEDENVEKEK